MKFAIITHAVHKLKDKKIYAYEPYVREMNLWLKYVGEVVIVAPVSNEGITSIDTKYELNERNHDEDNCHPKHVEGFCNTSENHENIKSLRQAQTDNKKRNVAFKKIKLTSIQAFDVTSFKNSINAIIKIPTICFNIFKVMKWADHIHLRCPGNIGILGCFVQILFPNKPKTIKYAGNWDPTSKQPLSYRFQKWILSNTFLTKNAKVLVYGEWPNQTKNIVPFFTATYSEKECHHSVLDTESHDLKMNNEMLKQVQHDDEKEQIATSQTPRNDGRINFIFVGALTKGKQPMLSAQVIHQLKQKGYNVQMNIYGEGEQRVVVEKYSIDNNLQNEIVLHGNNTKEIIKKAYQHAHFLLFISKSEGWPKVVAEAMFWGCLPITSNVSCVPYMLANGVRGAIVNPNVEEIVSVVENYIKNKEKYTAQVLKAKDWSRQFTLEKFEEGISKLL